MDTNSWKLYEFWTHLLKSSSIESVMPFMCHAKTVFLNTFCDRTEIAMTMNQLHFSSQHVHFVPNFSVLSSSLVFKKTCF